MSIDLKRFKPNIGDSEGDKDKQAWTEWLSDDKPTPTVQQELRQKRVKRANTYVRRPVITPPPVAPAAPKTKAANSGVSIQISIPEFHKPQFKRTKVAWHYAREHVTKRQIVTTSVIVGLVGALWLGLAILKHSNDHKAALAQGNYPSKALAAETQPTFTPAVPSTKQDLVTPDGKNSVYDSKKGNYSFYDTIGSKKFIVSEQKTASADAAKSVAAQAAKALKTNSQFKTGWGTAYVATNSNDNSQRLVLSVRELLVFIQSSSNISNDQWMDYINSLQ